MAVRREGPGVAPSQQWRTKASCLCPQESSTQALNQKFLEQQFSLLKCALGEAEQIVQSALHCLEDPTHVSCTSSAGQQARRASQSALSVPSSLPAPNGFSFSRANT